MQIVDLCADDAAAIEEVAEGLLTSRFRSEPTREAAFAYVRSSFGPGHLNRVVLGERGHALAWAHAVAYSEFAWKLQDLVVRDEFRALGIGTDLLDDLEEQIVSLGGTTLWLSLDDADGKTTLGELRAYPEPLIALARIKNVAGHIYERFEQRGFKIVGMLPDALGPKKPYIFMAKPLGADVESETSD